MQIIFTLTVVDAGCECWHPGGPPGGHTSCDQHCQNMKVTNYNSSCKVALMIRLSSTVQHLKKLASNMPHCWPHVIMCDCMKLTMLHTLYVLRASTATWWISMDVFESAMKTTATIFCVLSQPFQVMLKHIDPLNPWVLPNMSVLNQLIARHIPAIEVEDIYFSEPDHLGE